MSTTEHSTIEVGGIEYAVTRNDDPQRKMLGYELRGPRNAYYGLCRNVRNPDVLFAINMRASTPSVVKRLGWFTDKDGELKWVG